MKFTLSTNNLWKQMTSQEVIELVEEIQSLNKQLDEETNPKEK
jgi:hypothetical protein